MSYSPRESTLSEEIEWPLTTPKRGKRKERRRAQKDRVYPVEPKIIALFEKPYNTVNHSYRDFSQVPSEVNWVGIPPSVTEMTFPQRLHWLLQHPVHSTNASWRSHGRAFQITVPNHLHVKGVYHDVFGCKNYAVFLSKLQSWGFKLITKGRDGNCWYHEVSHILTVHRYQFAAWLFFNF